MEFWVEKGGGVVEQIQNIWGTFSKLFGEFDHTKNDQNVPIKVYLRNSFKNPREEGGQTCFGRNLKRFILLRTFLTVSLIWPLHD